MCLAFYILFPLLIVSKMNAKTPRNGDEIFRDDFNRSTLNPHIWNTANIASELNDEMQYYRPENAFINKSHLILRGDRQNYGDRNYTSARVDTRGKFEFLYGEIEWRARVARGQGVWSSLYLLPVECQAGLSCETNPPAVDMLDVRGDRLKESLLTVFWQGPKQKTVLVDTSIQSADKTVKHEKDMSLDFHLYKLVWQPTRLTWFIDGKECFVITGHRRVPYIRMQLVMALAIGGNFAHSPGNDTKFPADFLIDYVVIRKVTVDSAVTTTASPVGGGDTKVWLPVVIAIVGILAGVGFTVGLSCCIRKRRRCAKRNRIPPLLLNRPHPGDLQLSNVYNLSQGSDSGNCSNSSVADQSPYFRLLEIPVSQIEITPELLGKGQFGSVRKGFIADSGSRKPVAVKTVLECLDSDQDELQNHLFIEEMKVMTKVGRHLNIVNLLATVTTGKPMMVLEYCAHGSLLKYLQEQRSTYMDRVDNDGFLIESLPNTPRMSEVACFPGYVSVLSCQTSVALSAVRSTSVQALNTEDLIHICYQVARGLEYLAERSIIHRDIAARNVLVCENNIIKISDFGLARRRIYADYVLHSDQVALPIKWMAPESIFEKSFSYKSDIWSFGILMWEIFSLGQTPYTSIAGSGFTGHIIEFAHAVSEGLRMERPAPCPVFMYEIMSRCWSIDKDTRPSATALRSELSSHLPNVSTDHYLHLDEPYQEYNKINAALLAAPLSPFIALTSDTTLTPYATLTSEPNNFLSGNSEIIPS